MAVLSTGVASCSTVESSEGPSTSRVVERVEGAASAYDGGTPYPGACVKAGDTDGDGSPEWTLRRTYDAEGNVLQGVYDHQDDGTVDTVYRYSYSGGNLVRKTKDAPVDGEPDVVQSHRYDARGRRVETRVDTNADGDAEKVVELSYDDDHLRRKKTIYGDGERTSIWSYEYEEGRLVREYWDQDGNGRNDEVARYIYNEEGHLVRKTIERGSGGSPEQVVEFERKSDGTLLEKRVDEDGDGTFESVTSATYDDAGRRTKVVVDDDGDGVPDETTEFSYDDDGNLVEERWDGGADGAVDMVTTHDYGCWRGESG